MLAENAVNQAAIFQTNVYPVRCAKVFIEKLRTLLQGLSHF
jgi:hypothetical protein